MHSAYAVILKPLLAQGYTLSNINRHWRFSLATWTMGDLNTKESAMIIFFLFFGWWCSWGSGWPWIQQIACLCHLSAGTRGVCHHCPLSQNSFLFFFSECFLNTWMFSFQIVVTQDDIPSGRIKLFPKESLGLYGKAGLNPGCESTLPPCAAS